MKKRTTLTIENPYNPDKKAARAAQKAVLEEIYLVDAKTWRAPLVIPPDVLTLDHKCSREILIAGEDEMEDEGEYEERIHEILYNFRVAAFNDKSPNRPIMKIEATFYISFSVPSDDPDVIDYRKNFDPDSEDFNKTFGTWWDYIYTINPISTAWPYWREFVQSMSTRMGYPALTVPMLEIVLKKTPTKKVKSQPVKKETTRGEKVST